MEVTSPLEKVRNSLDQAKRILVVSGQYEADEWMLLATLIGDADLILREEEDSHPELRDLLGDVVQELKDVTRNFTAPEFLRSTRAARRRNRELFSVRA
jgi:hypothetical protein